MTLSLSDFQTTRTVFWQHGALYLIDQRHIPDRFELARFESVESIAAAIRDMVVRGAPAIGVTAAYGMVTAAQISNGQSVPDLLHDLESAARVLIAARPTAVNLAWAVNAMLDYARQAQAGSADNLRALLLVEADRMADADVSINRRIGAFGMDLIPQGGTVIHHCNTGSLATVQWGTALGVIRSAFEAGNPLSVLVDETRPRLQGARLTSWELNNLGIPHRVIVDGASGHFMRTGKVDLCLVGADRIAANGDTANKIGTYNLAIVAKEHNVPFYVAAPRSTIDLATPTGDQIHIEERGADEVTVINGSRIAPEGIHVGNPAFDVTPAHLIRGIITEYGVVRPPYEQSLRALFD